MFTKIILISMLCALSQQSTENWTKMRVTYGPTVIGADSSYLWTVPDTLEEAKAGNFSYVIEENNKFGCTLLGVAENDYGFTPCYDPSGYLSGAQLCQPAAVIESTAPSTYNATLQGTVERITYNGSEYFCSTFLWADPTSVAAGRTDVVEGNLGEGLWFRDTTSETGFWKVPDNLTELLDQTVYTQQNCFPGMGKHFFYNFTQSFDCDTFYNWFLLGLDDSISGIGFQFPGQAEVVSRGWYEFLPKLAAQIIAPDVNECLYDLVEDYGMISVHIYFQDSPWLITCLESLIELISG